MTRLRDQIQRLFSEQSKAAPFILDAAAVLFLLLVGLTVWPMDGDPSLPFWASPADPLLEGPDSGAWAANILAWSDGDYGYLEAQRMPTYVLFSGLAMAWTGSVALAGHLVNHLAHLLTPLLLYGIGRMMGSRAVGFGAGLMSAVCPFLVQASWRFGVDPTVAFVIPLSLWAGLLAARWWWLGPIAGVAGGLAMTAHFTTLFHALPAAFAVLLFASGWRTRMLAFSGYVAGAGLTWWGIFRTFNWGGLSTLNEAVPEGILKGSVDTMDGVQASPSWDAPSEVLRENMSGALGESVQLVLGALNTSALSWTLLLAAAWIGVLGVGLGDPKERRGLRGIWGLLDWRGGLVLILALGPLPFLAAAQAEERYSYNLLPIVCLLVARGIVGTTLLVERGIQRGWARWRPGLLAFVVVAFVARSYWSASVWKHKPLPPPMSARAGWIIGEAIQKEFEEIEGVVCSFREAIPYTGGRYCPKTRCPNYVNIEAFWDCLTIMDNECEGEGPIPYVVMWRRTGDEREIPRKAMDQWAIETWGTVAEIAVPLKTPEFMADIVSIPREDIRARRLLPAEGE
ncbi:MAG: glycosyltransferase family 39 protein [Myxococcota bacterium]|nr:glycosyltransferase family 39 protein [Myxococcota bacterium]